MGEDFRMGAKSCRWISLQTVTPLNLEFAISQTMKVRKLSGMNSSTRPSET